MGMPSAREKFTVKVISWNLLRLTGAAVEDVAALVRCEQPDLLLMQEATDTMDASPLLVGGYSGASPPPSEFTGSRHGALSRSRIIRSCRYPFLADAGYGYPRGSRNCSGLGMSPMPTSIYRMGSCSIACSYCRSLPLLKALRPVIGDHDAVGPTQLKAGFRDVGPREPTLVARNIVPFRLDRCLVRGLRCAAARTLARGPSDHCPVGSNEGGVTGDSL